jgi:hypothetical protein
MPLIKIQAFNGMTPRTDPRLLQGNMSQMSVNAKLNNGNVASYKVPGTVKTLSKTGVIKTIYRFGQDRVADDDYWFSWYEDVDVVRGAISGDAFERTYWTGEGYPRMTTSSIALSGGTNYPTNSYKLGVPAPANAITASIVGTGTGTAETRVYVYTYVTALGEEGTPSPISNAVDVKFGQTVNLSGMSVAPSGNYNITSKRIYRSVTGTKGTDYLFVAEIGVATQTYVDSVLAANLGEVCPSKTWEPPPEGLQGLTMMANGIMAGFVGRDVYFSEPYKPHAWPVQYVQSVDYPVVAIGAFGASLAVGTTGNPYVINGVDPMQMTVVKVETPQSCVSKRSLVAMNGGVMYASPDGIVLINGSGIQLVTQQIMTKDDWQTYKPTSITASQLDGRYYAFYDNGTTQGGFVLDLTGEGATFWLTDQYCTAAYSDIRSDSLYLAQGSAIKKWDYGSTPLTYKWKSKIFVTPQPINMMTAQVFATAYPVTFKTYADGILKLTKSVTNERPFKLPSGFKSKEWEIELSGTNPVNSVYMASSVYELKQA